LRPQADVLDPLLAPAQRLLFGAVERPHEHQRVDQPVVDQGLSDRKPFTVIAGQDDDGVGSPRWVGLRPDDRDEGDGDDQQERRQGGQQAEEWPPQDPPPRRDRMMHQTRSSLFGAARPALMLRPPL
jgi:hypothetical protein